MRNLLLTVIAGCTLSLAAPAAMAQQDVAICSSGTIVLGSFTQHVLELRRAHRSAPKEIDNLVAAERAGGPDFFSSQVVIERAASSDFDLNLFQGYSDPQTKIRNDVKWRCKAEDYPIAYFVGFKVMEISAGAIFVSREKGTVNVISLKKIDPELDKQTSVKDFPSRATLCEDIAKGCTKGIFYGRY